MSAAMVQVCKGIKFVYQLGGMHGNHSHREGERLTLTRILFLQLGKKVLNIRQRHKIKTGLFFIFKDLGLFSRAFQGLWVSPKAQYCFQGLFKARPQIQGLSRTRTNPEL